MVVDVENRSPTPVAVAFALRPYNPTGVAPVGRIDLVDDRTVTVWTARSPSLLPRGPGVDGVVALAAGDVLRLLEAEAPGGDQTTVSCPDRLAQAAFVYPVPHRTGVRVALPFSSRGGAGRRGRPVSSRRRGPPPAHWAAQGRRGLQVSLPPGRLADAIEANRSFVVLAAGRDDGDRSDRGARRVALATALHRWGFAPEAAMVSARAPGRRRAPATAGGMGERIGAGGRRPFDGRAGPPGDRRRRPWRAGPPAGVARRRLTELGMAGGAPGAALLRGPAPGTTGGRGPASWARPGTCSCARSERIRSG